MTVDTKTRDKEISDLLDILSEDMPSRKTDATIRKEIQRDWYIVGHDHGEEDWPLRDETFVELHRRYCAQNRLCLIFGLPVIDLSECPVDVTGWLSFVEATEWMKSKCDATGMTWNSKDLLDSLKLWENI